MARTTTCGPEVIVDTSAPHVSPSAETTLPVFASLGDDDVVARTYARCYAASLANRER